MSAMQKSAKRPVYLNLIQIRLPIGGVVSIIHRITGIVLTLLAAYALWLLQASLESPGRFDEVRAMLSAAPGRAAVLLVLWILIQHFYSGIRHLLLDIDVGVDIRKARISAWLTLAASVTTVVILGMLL